MMIYIGDLVLDKELGELAIVTEIRNGSYTLTALSDGTVYVVACGFAPEELEKIE